MKEGRAPAPTPCPTLYSTPAPTPCLTPVIQREFFKYININLNNHMPRRLSILSRTELSIFAAPSVRMTKLHDIANQRNVFSTKSRLCSNNDRNNDHEVESQDIQARIDDSKNRVSELEEDIYENLDEYRVHRNDIGTVLSRETKDNPEVHNRVVDELTKAQEICEDESGIGMEDISEEHYNNTEYPVDEAKEKVSSYIRGLEKIMDHTTEMIKIVERSGIEVSEDAKELCEEFHQGMTDNLEETKEMARNLVDSLDEYHNSMADKHRAEYSDISEDGGNGGSSASDGSSPSSNGGGSLLDDYADTSTEMPD